MFNLDLFFKDVLFKEFFDLKFQESINIFANNILNLKNKNEPLSIVTSSLNYQINL